MAEEKDKEKHEYSPPDVSKIEGHGNGRGMEPDESAHTRTCDIASQPSHAVEEMHQVEESAEAQKLIDEALKSSEERKEKKKKPPKRKAEEYEAYIAEIKKDFIM